MITITNNKVAGFEPRWAPFAGFSVLFDNPGNSLAQVGDMLQIACVPHENGPLDLYARLENTLNELDRDLLIRTYLFCPLPSSSYHVTVWDGINDGNIGAIPQPVRSEWPEFLAKLPCSIRTPPKSMSVVTLSALMNWASSISFKFAKLSLWGDQVLVARLQPADEASEQILSALSTIRTELSETARREFGLIARDYTPHVSLGYFANREHGQLADARIEHWTERFGARLINSTITFSSLDVYGFTDMASFFKS